MVAQMITTQSLNFGPYPYNSLLDIQIGQIDWQRWQRLVNVVADMFDAPASFINQANIKGMEVISASQKPETKYSRGKFSDIDTNVFCHHVVNRSASLYVPDASKDPLWRTNPEYTEDKFQSYLGMPILWPDGSVFGTLCVLDTQVTNYSESYIEVLSVIKEVVESDLTHLYRESQLLNLSYTDPLTELYNRRGFAELYSGTRDLAARLNRQLALIYFDLDGFKQVNDIHGHEMGDSLLKAFAQVLKENSRCCDLLARWGGDEFIVLVYAENALAIELYTERLQAVHRAKKNDLIRYSMGYCFIPPNCTEEFSTLSETAEKRMYQQKQAKA